MSSATQLERRLFDPADAAEPLAFVARVSLAPDEQTGVVDSIARATERRGERLGERLLAEALRCLRALGASRYALSVAAENRAALTLYERFGFEVLRVEPSYHSPDFQQRDGPWDR